MTRKLNNHCVVKIALHAVVCRGFLSKMDTCRPSNVHVDHSLTLQSVHYPVLLLYDVQCMTWKRYMAAGENDTHHAARDSYAYRSSKTYLSFDK